MGKEIAWFSEYRYAGGGERLPTPERCGTLVVADDGSVHIQCEHDDRSDGTLPPEQARELSLAIALATVTIPEGMTVEKVEEAVRSLVRRALAKGEVTEDTITGVCLMATLAGITIQPMAGEIIDVILPIGKRAQELSGLER